VHEFGHFITAKMFKTRVEKFYLFFDPWFSLFKFKKGETEYGVGWLPLGGYVKISGMMDESMDKEQMQQPAQPWEFRSKKTWQRLIIMLGGVTLNILLAFAIYIGMLWAWGDSTKVAKYGITVDSIGQQMGFQNGDKILALDGKKVVYFDKVITHILLDQVKTITVERNNQRVDFNVPNGIIGQILKSTTPFIQPRIPFIIDSIPDNSGAKNAGMQKGDQIITLDTLKTPFFDQFKTSLKQYAGKTVKIGVLRGKDTIYFNTNVNNNAIIGVYPKVTENICFAVTEYHYSFFQAIPAGFGKTIDGIDNYFKQLRLLFNKDVKAYKSVGGFISIGKIFPPSWDWYAFWTLTAFLSIMLAILNVLPIPALDGGHVMFLLFEMITGRKPSDKFLEYAQIVGMILLLALLLFANGNDIIRLFKH
jgi:regulator of sigma E protease